MRLSRSSRAQALITAVRNTNRRRKIETAAGAIIWGALWLMFGALIANAYIGQIWR